VARAELRLDDAEFWGMSPRMFFALHDEWMDVIDYKATIAALAYHGQPLPRREKEKDIESFEIHPDAW